MALPIINFPEYSTNLPSNDKQVFYRSFLVKEEKILLTALEGGEIADIENAVFNILCNCVQLTREEILQLPTFDIEWLFIKLRAQSVNNIIEFNVSHQADQECKHQTDVEINLNDVIIKKQDNHSNKIMINDEIGVVMKYPSLQTQREIKESSFGTNTDRIFNSIVKCVDYIFDQEKVYENIIHEEKVEWLEGLTKEQLDKIIQFFNNIPYIFYEINITCEACGEIEKIPLRGLQSFFG